MKKTFLLILVLLSSVVLFNNCQEEEEDTTLSIIVTQNPDGGYYVSSVSSEISGEIDGPTKDIEATIEWWWEDGSHNNAKILTSQTVTFNSKTATKKSAVYSAASGYVLTNYFWIKVSWSDDDGSHVVESAKAYCSY